MRAEAVISIRGFSQTRAPVYGDNITLVEVNPLIEKTDTESKSSVQKDVKKMYQAPPITCLKHPPQQKETSPCLREGGSILHMGITLLKDVGVRLLRHDHGHIIHLSNRYDQHKNGRKEGVYQGTRSESKEEWAGQASISVGERDQAVAAHACLRGT